MHAFILYMLKAWAVWLAAGTWQLAMSLCTTADLESFCDDFGNLPDTSLTLCMEISFLNATQRSYFHTKSEASVRQIAKVSTEALQAICCVVTSLVAAKSSASCQMTC